MVSMCSEKPICAPPHPSEISQRLPLKQFQCSSDWRWPSLILSRMIVKRYLFFFFFFLFLIKHTVCKVRKCMISLTFMLISLKTYSCPHARRYNNHAKLWAQQDRNLARKTSVSFTFLDAVDFKFAPRSLRLLWKV